MQSANWLIKRKLLLELVNRRTRRPLLQPVSLSCMGRPNGLIDRSRKDLLAQILLCNPMERYAVRLITP